MTPKEYFDKEIQPELDKLKKLLDYHDRCLTEHSIRLQELEMTAAVNAVDNINEELQMEGGDEKEDNIAELIAEKEFSEEYPLGGTLEPHEIEAEKEM